MAAPLLVPGLPPFVDFCCADEADAEPGGPPLRPDSAPPMAVHWCPFYLVASLPGGFHDDQEMTSLFASWVFSAILIEIGPRILPNLNCH